MLRWPADDCIEDNTLSPTSNDNAPQNCQHKEKKNKKSRKSQNLDKKIIFQLPLNKNQLYHRQQTHLHLIHRRIRVRIRLRIRLIKI